MINKGFHKFINSSSNPYFLDYVQLYFQLPLDELKQIPGYNTHDLKIWIQTTTKNLQKSLNIHSSQGIDIYPDLIHLGIKIHFRGHFFIHSNYKDDLIYLKKFTDILFNQILKDQYNPVIYNLPKFFKSEDYKKWYYHQQSFLENLCSIEFQNFYVSRLDIAQNLYFKHYKDGLKYDNWDTFTHHTLASNPNCIDAVFQDTKTGIVTGYSIGNPKYLILKIYNKEYDKAEFAQQNALERFGTYKFYRREWTINKMKLKGLKLRNLDNLLLMKNTHIFHYVLTTIRKSVDVVMKNDPAFYCLFHFKNIDKNAYIALKDQIFNYSKRIRLLLSGQYDKRKPIIDRKYVYWNGVDNILGIANKNRHRWNSTQWLKILDNLLLSPEMLPEKNNALRNIDIKKVEKFLNYIKS